MSIIPATERRRSTQSNEKITEVYVNGCFSIIAKLIHKNNEYNSWPLPEKHCLTQE